MRRRPRWRGIPPMRPTCRVMPARTCRSGTSPPDGSRTRAGPGSPIRTIPAARPDTRCVDGAHNRPSAQVPATAPEVVRSEGIAATPQASAHRADGLASGSVQDCGAGLQDAQTGGACGSVRYCVGGGCETVRARGGRRLRRGGDEAQHGDGTRRGRVRPGQPPLLHGPAPRLHHPLGRARQLLQELRAAGRAGQLQPGEVELARERNQGHTHYLGQYCARRVLGVCIRRDRAWCVFGSKLGRIFQQQGRVQLGIGWGSCRGLTVAELEGIDFDALDLSEFTSDLLDSGKDPSVDLPGTGDTQTLLRDRIRSFYRQGN